MFFIFLEFSILIRYFLSTVPFKTNQASVIPVEIKVKPCPNSVEGACFVSIKLSGKLEFVEENDYSVDPKKPTPLAVIDWNKTRKGYVFGSLNKVLLRIRLSERGVTDRKFVLQTLSYDYDNKNSPFEIYSREASLNPTTKKTWFINEPTWNNDLRQI